MALNEEHVKYPEEMSIVGFDDLILPSILHTQLTVMSQPMEKMGRAAASLLLKRIHGKKSAKPEHIIFDAVLLGGNSGSENILWKSREKRLQSRGEIV